MKQIPLTQGKFALVDDEDYEFLNKWKWCLSHGYPSKAIKKEDGRKSCLLMHRLIMQAPDGVMVDHKNGCRFDNRKENLRLCSGTENQRNQRLRKTNSSGYKGVSFHKSTRKWMARIRVNKVQIYIGNFNSPEEAYLAYCEKAKELFGEFARFE
jgi:hypothetical protein